MRLSSHPKTVRDKIDYLFAVTAPPFLEEASFNLYYGFHIGSSTRTILDFKRLHVFYQHDWTPTSFLYLAGDPEQSTQEDAHVTARIVEDADLAQIQISLYGLPTLITAEEGEKTVRFLAKRATLPGFEDGIRVPYEGDTIARRVIEALPEKLR